MKFRTSIAVAALVSSSVWAASLADLSNTEATSGLRAALEKGAESAVGKLGVENGFLSNEKVRISLPSSLDKAQSILRMTGQGPKMDELIVAMNHAAEAAVPMAKPLLMNAIKSMSVTDAKNILSGGDTSVTDFFRQKTSAQLAEQFQPVVKSVTDKSDLSAKYNSLMGPAAKYGVVPAQQATVESYVTERAVDGLFLMIGEEEKAIRQDPLGTGSKIIGQVFGLLK
ncbi:DUF4197 domain-containing protein [Solimicrobium silvestre]|uniref:DUF4197 domain-containing protein n=1 Tax=Solimicrobium silvestre TaxID=2099400 RepID=A0A2S9H487_9BURK|nr:DUF4197 domain-containing protein [Solimicrobium silvestre]PRC94788.1 hypothetical protein S2091_0791 [Solimicrobium silvestre]